MYNINEIKKRLEKTSADAGPVDMVGDDSATEDDLGGDDSMDMGGDAGGDMGMGDMGGDAGGDMGMGGEPSAPQLDYENIFIDRTHDLEQALEDNEDFDIDYSRLT